jgi:hypothetical protein
LLASRKNGSLVERYSGAVHGDPKHFERS